MKTLALVMLALTAPLAQASELKLSLAEVAAKKLTICRNLQTSIVQVSQLANHHSLEATAEDASFFTRMQAELLQNFKQLQCENRLDQAAADHAALIAKCRSYRGEARKLNDELDQIAIEGLRTGNSQQKRTDVLYAKVARIQDAAQKAGCQKVANQH